MVEFIVVLPALLIILFGIVEFASAWRTHHILTNVARDGVRIAVTPSSPDDAGVEQAVRDRLDGSGLDSSKATITLACEDDNGNMVEGSLCNQGDSGKAESVQIDYPYTFLFLGRLLNYAACAGGGCGDRFGTITLSSTAIMRNE